MRLSVCIWRTRLPRLCTRRNTNDFSPTAHHELVEELVVRSRRRLLREAAEEQRSGPEEQAQEEGTRDRDRQEEAKTRDDLCETSEAN